MSLKKLVSMFAMVTLFGLSASLTGCDNGDDDPAPVETGGEEDTGAAAE